MNRVELIGRLTRDVDFRETESVKLARFAIAIDRGKDKDGKDRGADFPPVVCFGSLANVASKYLHKGSNVGVEGHIQTGSYEKDGQKVYTVEIIADKLEFLDPKESGSAPAPSAAAPASASASPAGTSRYDDDDIPF